MVFILFRRYKNFLIVLFIFILQGEALNVNANEFKPRSANGNSIGGTSENLGRDNNLCQYCVSSFVSKICTLPGFFPHRFQC